MDQLEPRKKICQVVHLIEPYFRLGRYGPAPFPGYMYRCNALNGLKFDTVKGGKHSDVAFLTEVLERGPIIWLGDCLIQYRFHGENDSSVENVPDRLKLLRYLISKRVLERGSILHMDYRFIYCTNWIKQNRGQVLVSLLKWRKQDHRTRIFLRFIVFWLIRMAVTRRDFWFRLARVLRKLVANRISARSVKKLSNFQ